MNNSAKNLWAVYAEDAALFLRHNMITLGWKEMGDLSDLDADKAAFRERFRKTYPDETPVARAGAGTLLFRLIHEVRTGDAIAMPSGSWVYLGVVSGPYTCEEHLGQCRKVRWLKRLPKSDFSRDAMREIGSSPMRLFAVKNRTWEFFSAMGTLDVQEPPISSTPNFNAGTADFSGETAENGSADNGPAQSGLSEDGAAKGGSARGELPGSGSVTPPQTQWENAPRLPDTPRFVLTTLRKKLDREGFQDFAAELLRAMGHQVEEPPRRGGMDFLTVRDDLLPRVLIYAKSGPVREADIALMERSLEGGQSGLILTLWEFSAEVRDSLRTAPGLRAVDGAQLAELILKYYRLLPARCQRLIPLRTVYFPDI